MNIAIDSRILVSNFRGGILVYTERLVEELARIDRDNRYQLLFTGINLRPDAVKLDVGPNFRKVVLPLPDRDYPGRTFLWKELALRLYFAVGRTDVYHLPALHELTTARRVKKVITIHDLRSAHIDDVTPQNLEVMRRSCQVADRVITVSDFTRQDVIRNFRLPEHKVQTVYLGVDPDFRVLEDRAPVQALEQRLGLDKPYFLSLGLVPRKNIERLLRAYAAFRHREEFYLLLAGHTGGEWVERYRGLVRELGLEGQVKMPGSVPLDELVLLYNGAHAFVFPSLCEGFGIPVLEAMACGAPVLTSNISALPEVTGGSAVIVDPYSEASISDGLEQLAEDEELRTRLISEGRARAAEFTWKRMAREIQQVYTSL